MAVSHSRGSKVKGQNQKVDGDVFWMSLEDARQALLTSKFEFLEDREERRSRKKSV